MNTSTKEIIFFLLIFVMIILSGSLTEIIHGNKPNNLLTLTGISVVSTLILYIIFKISPKKEDFHFEVTPEKTCDGGAYLHQSNKMCQKLWNTPEGRRDLANYNCINGYCNGSQGLYNGRPLNMGYRQDLSNDKWENELADYPILEADSPMVL
jgi:hypothetical protein